MKTKRKFTISVDEMLIKELDRAVRAGKFESRSAALELALGMLVDQQVDVRTELSIQAEMDVTTIELESKRYVIVPKAAYTQLARAAHVARHGARKGA